MKNLWLIFLNAVFCLVFGSCQTSEKNYQVNKVERNSVMPDNADKNSLLLIVKISNEGKLSLNRIETGTIGDSAELSGKLKVIFEDREKNKIAEREVLIEATDDISEKDLQRLIKSLKEAHAEPVRLIKD